jgi:hypothetical protein
VIVCIITPCSLIVLPRVPKDLVPPLSEGLHMTPRQLGDDKFVKQCVKKSHPPIAAACLLLNIITGPRSHVSSSASGFVSKIIKKISFLRA